jgi:predicted metal-dependent phosphoesterase TrpH
LENGSDTGVKRLPPEERKEFEEQGAVLAPQLEGDEGLMKIDLHCHSAASPDCVTPLKKIPERCLERGIQVQAITDHNLIWGAQEIRDLQKDKNHLKIITGEEITTTEGELIGLFLNRPVPAGLSPEETVERIKAQDGLVLLPHGFDPFKRWRLNPQARERIKESIDIVETFNARVSRRRWNRAAVRWSQAHGALMSAGSDAHTLKDIGAAWCEVPQKSIQSPPDLLAALEGGVPVGHWTHPVIAYLLKTLYRLQQKI